MNKQRPRLEPSLWRTCRVLANRARLACLRTVLAHPSATVEEVANACAISEARASLHLRALQARGLLSAERRVRWVHYVATTDVHVVHAESLLAALTTHLGIDHPPLEDIVHTVTALTHPRRIEVCRALQGASLTAEQLQRKTQISAPALSRHLSKLVRRSFVARDDKGAWHLSPARSQLHAVLLDSLKA